MILFRADGNPKIGMGHIMRCLSVADTFGRNGEQSVFVLADSRLKEFIADRGHEAVVLNTDYENMPGETDLLKGLIKKYRPRCLFIDSYYVTKEYLAELKRLVKTVYIDDLAAFAYPADILINYNIYAESIDYHTLYERENVTLPRLLLGVEFAPLREEFANAEKKAVSEKCRNVLISTGGADPVHLALKLAEYIANGSHDGLTYHFIIGAANTDKEKIKITAEHSDNIVLHSNVKNMKELICSCDLTVSAAGSTLYEICACGVPLITYVLADNQTAGAKAFEEKGLAVNCGDIRNNEDPAKLLYGTIIKYSSDKDALSGMKKKAEIIDGLGAYRIIDFVLRTLF